MQKLRVFIGSSSEGRQIAEELRERLSTIADAVVWTGIFHLGDTSIEALFAELRRATHAVLVATADDVARVRGRQYSAPRDNVIFELGLFMGRLGRRRTYLLAERALKLPSDLAGLTIAHFEMDRISKFVQADHAIAQLIEAIDRETIDEEAHLIESLLRLVGREPIRLRTTYEQLIRSRFQEISAEIASLRRTKDWHRLIAAKTLLREYLEYSGAYHDAIRFGEYYSEALLSLGRRFEAAWSRVKDIGYMNILAGRHSEGRAAIEEVIAERPVWEVGVSSDEVHELLAYANRYLAISHHRGIASVDLDRARRYLDVAVAEAGQIRDGAKRRGLLDARLKRNRAHLYLAVNEYDKAMHLYEECLTEFEHLNEVEHVASTQVSMVKALIREGVPDATQALQLLTQAERTFESLAALEGLAQAALLRSQLSVLGARSTDNEVERNRLIVEAEACSSRARALFLAISTRQYGNDLDVLAGELARLKRKS